MSFIKTRKKIVSSAIASSFSIMAGNAIAQEPQVAQLKTIHTEAVVEQNLKVDTSANDKYLTSLLDAPKSVAVISQQFIEDTQVTTLSDALRLVPGITLGAGEGGNPNGDRPFIRGYSAESSIYVDGIRNATSQNRDMFAIEQVEITKGSGSSLGGAGSVGGSINLITKEAKKGSFIQGSVEGGTDNYQRITLDGNKDFGNGIAARVALLGHKNEKPGQDNGAEYKRFGIAPSISFGLDTPTRATLSYYYLKSNDTPDSGVPYWTDGKAAGTPLDVKQGVYYGWKDRDFQKQENHIGTIKVEHDLNEDLTIANIATYSKSKNDFIWTQPDDSKANIANGSVARRANTRITSTESYSDQLSLRGKFNTGILQHRFNTGVEYSHQKSDKGSYTIYDLNGSTTTLPNGKLNDVANGSLDLSGNGACAGLIGAASNYWCTSAYNPNPSDPFLGSISANKAVTTTTAKTTSLYFLDNIEINPQWLLDLGVRWDKFDTELKTNATGVKLTNNTDFWSWNAGLTYKPAENGAIYISYATSANPVGIDAGDGSELSVNANNQDLDPEKARTYELGTKWDLLNDRLNVTASIFRTEKQNTRIQLDPNTYTNGGKSKVDGFELGINGNITEKWAVSAGYTYLDSKATKNGFSCRNNKCTDQSGYNGNQLPNVPKNSATLWTTYQVLPQLMIGGGAVAMDKVYGDLANEKWVPGYVRYDLVARYNVNENVNLQLNVNNVTDKRYFTKAYASHYATEADGRNAVLSLNFKY
ncbi:MULTISPECIES: TonB-dependent receptor [unclassified Acinetobacter]|uniref:TonB-dependent receptor n=1 Tax=unclassified Acinetobacter TaxID=196816 RepID=UPI00293445E6|nr:MULTISPECIES: TonB-dependent receptor [unclassified Acinetobacter]WOE30512.1 TonB-dependent receptor [Acinetobacter sp. SAAs470]WOE38703.1 TonB-dependent receptor [Acinetobacter sp. SAAs474]